MLKASFDEVAEGSLLLCYVAYDMYDAGGVYVLQRPVRTSSVPEGLREEV